MMRFDRFSERAQDVAARAYEVTQRYGHNQADTEHILLALLEQPEGAVPRILEQLSVDQELIKKRLDDVLRAPPKAAIYGGGTGQVFITPRVKRIVDLANEEANRLKDEYISTGHIFLAILSERNTAVARVLSQAGLTHERVAEIVGQSSAEAAARRPNGAETIRLSVDVSLANVLDLIDRLPVEQARQVYERLRQRFEKA